MKKLTLNRPGIAGNDIPKNPNTPISLSQNPDPTRKMHGGNEPDKIDPTRIKEPLTTDPTRIEPVEPKPETPTRTGEIVLWSHYNG